MLIFYCLFFAGLYAVLAKQILFSFTGNVFASVGKVRLHAKRCKEVSGVTKAAWNQTLFSFPQKILPIFNTAIKCTDNQRFNSSINPFANI
jgi:hypothetical protein